MAGMITLTLVYADTDWFEADFITMYETQFI